MMAGRVQWLCHFEQQTEAAKAVLGCRRLMGSRLQAVRAYSSGTTPTEEYRVKTWWRDGGCGR